MNVHIYPSYFTSESRILRIVETLRAYRVFERFLVVAIRRTDLPNDERLAPNVRLVRVAPAFGRSLPGRIGRLVKALGWYASTLNLLRVQPVTCINCHSLSVLPIGVVIKMLKRCRLVYDTHELETETVSSRGLRRWVARLTERLLIGWCDAVSAVNRSIADWYQHRYRLAQVAVVRNMPRDLRSTSGRTGRLRAAVGLPSDPNCQVYLYQGLLTRGRGIQLLLDVFPRLGDDRHLVFMGYGDLEGVVRDAAARHSNIHLVPAVPPDQVLDYTADADVGLSVVENVCLSYYYSLPNKVFEYAVCGVPSLVSRFPEMARFVEETGFGWAVEPEAGALLARLRSLDAVEIERVKARVRAGGPRFEWATEEPSLLALYARLGFGTRASGSEIV